MPGGRLSGPVTDPLNKHLSVTHLSLSAPCMYADVPYLLSVHDQAAKKHEKKGAEAHYKQLIPNVRDKFSGSLLILGHLRKKEIKKNNAAMRLQSTPTTQPYF